MIAGMGRGKAGAAGAVIDEHSYLVPDLGIPAGPVPENEHFYQVAAEKVAHDCGHDQGGAPQPSFPAEIECCQQQQEKVKGDPELRLPGKWQHGIKKRIGPVTVNPPKQPVIEVKQFPENQGVALVEE
jgi:hypothetical protein